MPFWLVFDILLLVVTLIPFCRWEHYAVRGWDFPRLQIAWLALASIVIRLSLLDGWQTLDLIAVLAAGLALGIQACWIFPYTFLARSEVKDSQKRVPERSIRLMTANVLQTNRRADAFIDLVRAANPDVLVILEADQWWQDRLDVFELEGYEHTQKCPQDNLYGMLLYSKLELADQRTEFLVEEDVPSMHGQLRLASGEWIAAHWLHPKPPSPSENMASRERDAELIVVGKRVAERVETPTLVAGDLNDVAWSATTRLFRRVSGLLDPRVGRGFFSSFNAKLPGLRWPLDHVFHSKEFTLVEISRMPGFGSDHFPLLMELQLQEGSAVAEGLQAEDGDEERAKQKMDAEDVRPSDVP